MNYFHVIGTHFQNHTNTLQVLALQRRNERIKKNTYLRASGILLSLDVICNARIQSKQEFQTESLPEQYLLPWELELRAR